MSTSRSLTIVGIILLLWNLMGVMAFVMQYGMDLTDLARTDPVTARDFLLNGASRMIRAAEQLEQGAPAAPRPAAIAPAVPRFDVIDYDDLGNLDVAL